MKRRSKESRYLKPSSYDVVVVNDAVVVGGGGDGEYGFERLYPSENRANLPAI